MIALAPPCRWRERKVLIGDVDLPFPPPKLDIADDIVSDTRTAHLEMTLFQEGRPIRRPSEIKSETRLVVIELKAKDSERLENLHRYRADPHLHRLRQQRSRNAQVPVRSEEHTSERTSLMP